MHHQPLLAHLADRFITQRENLATEALAHILSRSAVARATLIRTLRLLGADLPDDLLFRTQAASDDQAIPDLVGEDGARLQRLIVEVKFWAGLTDRQPVTYLRRLHTQGGGTLAFLVPAMRAELVWRAITDRCVEAGIAVEPSGGAALCATAGPNTFLCLTTWKQLVSILLAEVEGVGEQVTASDLRQLQGLCDREDSEAFLPLTSEELTGSIPRRILQLSDLVDDLTGRLVRAGLADISRLKATGGKGYYTRYMTMHRVGCGLQLNLRNWGRTAFTPLWLRIHGPNWKIDPTLLQHLLRRAAEHHLQVAQTADLPEIPISLPTNVERERVFDVAFGQLARIAGWLSEVQVPNGTMVTAVPEEVAQAVPEEDVESTGV